MFYYYGGKRHLARRYPPPAYRTIIEPFAGSAAYSMEHLRYADRVILFEKDARVCETWWRLLAMEPRDLLALPVPEVGEWTTDFLVMTAATSGTIARCKGMHVTERQPRVFRLMLRQMAALLPEAKRKVEVFCADYQAAANVEATWFIDPPYQLSADRPGTDYPQGLGYARGCDSRSIDYAALGDWCRERRGQKIVCEQRGADWLPFRHLHSARDGIGRNRAEVAWIEPEHQLELISSVGLHAT